MAGNEHSRSSYSYRLFVLAAGIVIPAALLALGANGAQVSGKRHRSAHTASTSSSPAQLGFDKDVAPVVKKYCVSCHSGPSAQSGVNLEKYKTVASALKDRDTWDRVVNALSSNVMPPAGMPHPTMAERDRITTWIQTSLSNAACDVKDPGRVTLRRLNREEYNNTVRDLFGTDLRPGDEFPNDDVGYGFDNIGDVLSISPLLMEKYLNAAEKVSKAVVALPGSAEMLKHVQAAQAEQTAGSGQVFGDGYRVIQTAGEVSNVFDFPQSGEYELRVRAFQQRMGTEPAKMSIRLDGREVKELSVTASAFKPETYYVRTKVEAGKRRVSIAFLNPFHDDTPDPMGKRKPDYRFRDRTLTVMFIEVAGPFDAKTLPTEAQRKLIAASPTENTPLAWELAARKDLKPFAERAYRRPVSDAEVERLVKCALLARDNGESFERGMQLAIQAALVSPNFLFRVETDAPGNTSPNPLLRKEGAKRSAAVSAPVDRQLNPYELANRLSYFLWSSMPDEELMRAAANGSIQKPAGLRAQVARMLKDPKAKALGENFAGQWLMLRSLKNVSPNKDQFPDFNDTLRAAMKTETEMFFNDVVRNDRSILDFIDGKFTYLNEPLAKHYGLTNLGVAGENFRRIALTGDERGGILTQASVLTVTSNPTRTSPVKRGKWVLENLLGTPPPPPPANVPALDKPAGTPLVGTLRQRMEEHRKNPACASCHARMDPIGFGLENFDAVGRWRSKDGDAKIDASGALPGGIKFDGPAGLEKYLKGKKELFTRCLSEKMLTYAIGRGLENYDRCNVDAIIKSVSKNDYRFSSLVMAVVESDPFRKRRGEGLIQ